MKRLMISLILLLFTVALVANANGPTFVGRPPGAIKCNDVVKICEYVVQNLRANDLVARINKIMFAGSILSPHEGFINVETLKKINFWFEDNELKERFVALIPMLDMLEDFVPSRLVQLNTEIFSLSESAMRNLEASISSSSSRVGDAPNWNVTNQNGALDIALKIGSSFLSSVLGSTVVKKESKRMTRITQLIPNLSGINYENTTNIYVSATSGSVEKEVAGIKIGGTVSVSRNDPDLIVVKDYSFRYGILKRGDDDDIDRVSVLKVTTPEFYLVKGTSSMIVSNVTTEQGRTRSWGIFSLGRSRDSLQSKMMVITRARSVSFDDYIAEIKSLRTRTSLYGIFSRETVESLPDDGLEVKKVLKHLKAFSYFTNSGDRKIGFWIDRKHATKKNYNKSFEIKIKGGGKKLKKTLSLENMMTTGLYFPELGVDALEKSYIKFKVTLREFRSKFRSQIKKTFYYNPETNQFIVK